MPWPSCACSQALRRGRAAGCLRRPSLADGDAAYLFFEAATATHLPNALLVVPYFDAKSVALVLSAPLQNFAAVVSDCACAATDFETASETHLPKAFAELPLPFDVLLP